MFGISAMGASVYSRPQKHLYLVLDDSSSMGSEGTADANYSLQTLLAMTDKTDTIDIYFLNAGEKVYKGLQLSQKSNAMLENIKVNYPDYSGSTPYTVVSTAQKDLRNAVAADDTGEYWLVVVTDGDFNYPTMDYKEDLKKFASTPLKNGKLPNLMCVAINSSSVIPPSEATTDNIHVHEGIDIISSMNDAAKAISGRIDVSDKKVSSDGKTLSFSFPYPARNIVILTQNTQTKIVNSSATSKLNTSENYIVARPIPTPQLDKSTVCFITESNGGSIAPGNVSVTFDKAIDVNNTVVVVEPAIGLMAHFYSQDGTECDPSQLKVGETAKLVYKICDPTTKKEIDESIIQGNIKYYVDINGKRYDDNEFEFKVESDELKLDMYAEFSDGFVLDIHNNFKDLKEFRVVSLNLSNATFTADINSIKDTDVITAKPTYNGNNFLNDEFKACSFEVTGLGNPFKLRVDIKEDPATGTYTISPKGGFLKVFTPKQQEIEVKFVSDKGEVVTEKIAIELTGTRNWLPIIIAIIAIIFLIWCIVFYVLKPKFPLDLKLWVYLDKGGGINFSKPTMKKSILTPGVIKFRSILPWKNPVVLKLDKFGMPGIEIEATKGNKNIEYLAYVKNVKTSEVESTMVVGGTVIKMGAPVKTEDYKIVDSSYSFKVGFTKEDPKNLHLREGEFIQEQRHRVKQGGAKVILYARKKTLKDKGYLR